MSASVQRGAGSWTRLAGVAVTLAAAMALWAAARMLHDQVRYFRIKYGRHAERSADQVEARADALWRRYPANYYLSLHMASGWWTRYAESDGHGDTDALAASHRWVRRGLKAHPLLSDFHLLEARIQQVTDPRAAAATWDAYVDRHYWNAFNQAMRVDFHAQAGAFTTASEILTLLRGRPHHDWASARFRTALRESMAPPPRRP